MQFTLSTTSICLIYTQVRDRILNTSSSSNTNNKRKMALVVIDEIDALVHKQTTGGPLHRLFEWASLPNSNLVLIGIANGVNLISKFFPRLRALRCEPELLVFEPYVLISLSPSSVFLSMCATTDNKHHHQQQQTDTMRPSSKKFYHNVSQRTINSFQTRYLNSLHARLLPFLVTQEVHLTCVVLLWI